MEGAAGEDEAVPPFQDADTFAGARPGMVFKLGHLGLGYYLDPLQANKMLLDEVKPKLPERWREAKIREERLRVDVSAGCGLSLEFSDFGFAVEEVEDMPGQQLEAGEVIVAIEGRILAGMTGPQMQASFHKRRLNGARMHVANLIQVQELSLRDPAIVEQWDNIKKANYYFHKKSGKTAWTWQELMPAAGEAASASDGPAAQAAQAQPIDLAHFLTHGFAKPKEPVKKKMKVAAKKEGEEGKDLSDFAREERARINAWNEGGTGGYTDAFFSRYSGNMKSEAPKKDKRLKGSVGPGNGMEYMARWTGSKNSFN